jgi:uncharacterized protein (DUF433 family)
MCIGKLAIRLARQIGGQDSMTFDRIELSPDVMGGKPCIRGTRVTVDTLVGLLSKGHLQEEILKFYPYIK